MTSASLPPHNVHVWWRPTDEAPDVCDADLVELSPDERARCARFTLPRDRRDFAAAHALLRNRLSHYADVKPAAWTFDTLPDGKPVIASTSGQPGLAFNLSHTRGFVACAIAAGGEVGIDLESLDRAVDGRRIAARHFSEPECDWLDDCDGRESAIRFIELWTLKEAYVKAIGRGLGQPLNGFGFAFDDEHGIRFSAPPGTRASEWTFGLFAPSPRHRMAVAERSTPPACGAFVARSMNGMVTVAIRTSRALESPFTSGTPPA